MKEPILVIMAAGMGSRYGGLKQMDPVGPDGEAILDYSLFDARRAGFKRAIILIKHEIEEDFMRVVGNRLAGQMVAGTGQLLVESGQHPAAMKDAAVPPAAPPWWAWRRWSAAACGRR